MSSFTKLSSWACSVACGVCLMLAVLATPGATLADPGTGGGGGETITRCANPTRDSCPDEVTSISCIAATGCDAANGTFCNCAHTQLPTFSCYCP